MNTHTSLSKILALILSLAMVFSVTPVTAFAEEAAPPPGESIAGEPPVATPSGAEPITGDEFEAEPDPETEPPATVTDGVSLGESGDTATPTDTTPGVTITITGESEYSNALYLDAGVAVTDEMLLAGVSAKDESGEAVTVTVAEAGGLDRNDPQPKGEPGNPEPYTITYAAGDATETRGCFVTPGIMKLAGTVSNFSELQSTVDGGGVVTITGNIGMTGTIEVKNGVTVTLTGGTLTRDPNHTGSLFEVQSGGTLTLENITIDGNKNNVTQATGLINNAGTLNINSGAVLNNNSKMSDGRNGGAVYNNGGTVTMSGGEISGNEAMDGGGIFNTNDGTVTIDGGSISGNTANNNGGGIFNENGEINIDGGTISGNTADRNGGGIFNQRELNVTGGSISGNTANYDGGGIYNTGDGTVTIDGGSIGGNTADSNGGGISNTNDGTVTIDGGSISGNTAGSGGGIANAGELNVNGGTISGNTADNGGGIINAGGTGSVTSPAKLKDNTATEANGGNNLGGYLDGITVGSGTNIYSVTFSVASGNGTLTPPNGYVVPESGKVEVESGATVTFTATPDPGWRVKEWKLGNTAVSGNTTITYTTGAITETGVIVTVEFEQITADLALSMSADKAGYTFGDTINYTVTVKNNSLEAASDVTVTGVTAAINTPQYSLDNGSTWQAWNGSYNAGALSSSGTVTIKIRGTVNATGTIKNTASVTSASADLITTDNSATVDVTVNPAPPLDVAPEITTQPTDKSITEGNTTTFTVAASGTPAPSYQWQVSTDNGGNWSDIANSGVYSGAATPTLTLMAVPLAYSGYQYRCVATNSKGSATSNVAMVTVNAYTPPAPGQVEPPTATPNGGSFATSQTVTLSCDTDGAAIHYTTDGSDPTAGSPVYTEPFTVTPPATVKAIAVKSGMANSEIMTAVFTVPPIEPTEPTESATPSPSPSSSSDNDDSSYTPNRTAAPLETWMTAQNLRNPSRSTGKFGVRVSAWNALTEPYYHDSMSGNAVQIRAYFDSPSLFTKDTYVSGWTSGADADRIRGFFEKWFSNKIRAIHFDQTGQWESQIRVAAKLDLAGWDTRRLYFYVYDPKINSYRRIEDSAYWLDANGYLHFQTEYAGEIVVSEEPLEKR